mmetsp:Transcript_48217/g.35402  ORF Transcript_48217/g.35402 Transcript_48217/m.35402 type:complete len:85 (+) Transcript_48217:507-761(+)
MIKHLDIVEQFSMVIAFTEVLNTQLHDVVVDFFKGDDPLGLHFSSFLPNFHQVVSHFKEVLNCHPCIPEEIKLQNPHILVVRLA